MRRSDVLFARLASLYFLGGGGALFLLSEISFGSANAAFLTIFAIYYLYGVSFPGLLYFLARRNLGGGEEHPSPETVHPGITVAIPAFNEGDVITTCIDSLLAQERPVERIVVVNDGSSDDTLAVLKRRYKLAVVHRPGAVGADPAVRSLYQSARVPSLWVIDKANGGKARALNSALALTESAVFTTADADTYFMPNALSAIGRHLAADPEVVAAGGVIAAANGADPKALMGGATALPRGLIAKFQAIEYAINFVWRFGWQQLNASLLLSGSFTAFRTEILRTVGGFDPESLTEDYEISYRLHMHCRLQGRPYRVVTASDAVAYTLVPETLSGLLEQRTRWFQGFLQTLVRYRWAVGRGRFGWLGNFALPVKVFDALAPAWGLAAYGLLVHSLISGSFPVSLQLLFAVLAFRWLSDVVQSWFLLSLNHHRIAPRLGRGQYAVLMALMPINVWFQRTLWFAYGLKAYYRVLWQVRRWDRRRGEGRRPLGRGAVL